MNAQAPIGIFDSGIGGLTVLEELQKELPFEQFIYLADNKYHPYGSKPPFLLQGIVERNLFFLKNRGVKLIVVACHTASIYGLKAAGQRVGIPIIGMIEPTITSVLGLAPSFLTIIGTEATIKSNLYPSLLQEKLPPCHIESIPAPKLVEIVESKKKEYINDFLSQLFSENLHQENNTILLACTHFPLVKKEMQIFFPKSILLDPASQVAKEVLSFLKKNKITNNDKDKTSPILINTIKEFNII